MKQSRWGLLVIALALLALFAVKNQFLAPPKAPILVSKGEFEQQRAIERLQRILGDQRPHPVDSAADDDVRQRLITELRTMGIEPRVQESTDCSDFPKSRSVSCSHVRNVIAVLPGPNRPALLLNAHYDSTPTGPGAADDGIGVATMLEVAYLVKTAPRDRPIIFLFNEGEEYGLNGAAAFVARDPLARTVGRLINMESRGVSGPASMFETNTPNGAALADFSVATRHPFANSLTADLAKLIPNTTDVVKFKPRGWETLNYAIVGNETRYHSPGDTIEALSRDSLAHMGSEVLAATRQLSGPGAKSGTRQTVYADVFGLFFLRLPQGLALAGVGILAIAAIGLSWRRRAWRSLGATALITAGALIVVAMPLILISFVRQGDYWRAYPALVYFAVYAALLAALVFGVVRMTKRHDPTHRRLAIWTLSLIIGAILSALLPGASIYFLIGPALALIGIALAPRSASVGRALVFAGALVQLVMLTEIMAIFELLLIDGPLWAVAPVAALASLPLLTEAGSTSSRRNWLPLVVMAVIAWFATLLVPRGNADRPEAFTLDYVRDDARGHTNWAVASKQAPIPATMDHFGPWKAGKLPYNGRLRWLAEAPVLNIAQASLVQRQYVATRDGRLATLQIATGGADAVLLRFDKQVPILAMGLPGQLHRINRAQSEGPTIIRCSGRSCDGLRVEVEIGTKEPVEALLVAQQYGPPAEAAPLLAAAPKPSHPQYAPHSRLRIRGYQL